MLYWLTQWIAQYHHDFTVFQYLTLRGILSVATALLITLFIGPLMIRMLTLHRVSETVRDIVQLENHKGKNGTPTMGGVLLITSILLTTLLWGRLSNPYIWLLTLTVLCFALIGAYDDFCKLTKKENRGLSVKLKYFLQSLVAISASFVLYHYVKNSQETQLVVPFFKHVVVHLGWGYLVLSYFTIIGSSNAVNLTDGLDGLAIMPVVLIAGALGIFAYLTGNVEFARYLFIPYIPGAGEIIIFVGALVGSGLGFLWFNTYPAQIFMGDIGSLSLGAALGVVAVMVRQEVVFFFISGIFVLETLSVILQVSLFRLTGKRIFKMAPIHHHFELKGWPEPRIIVRFWIITLILVLIGLATLKIR